VTDNIYQSPDSDLTDHDNAAASIGGSLETALLGEYTISIKEVRDKAWNLTKGNKGVIWLAVLVSTVISFGASFALGLLGLSGGTTEMGDG